MQSCAFLPVYKSWVGTKFMQNHRAWPHMKLEYSERTLGSRLLRWIWLQVHLLSDRNCGPLLKKFSFFMEKFKVWKQSKKKN